MVPSSNKAFGKRTASGMAAFAIVGAAIVAGAVPASADDTPDVDPCDLSKTVAQLRDYGDDTSKNVIVYNKGVEDTSRFEGVVEEGVVTKESGCEEPDAPTNRKDFRYVVFSGSGEFERDGDGGYRNWAFAGDFDRVSDEKVEFHAQ